MAITAWRPMISSMLTAVIVEVMRVGMGEQHRAIDVKSAPQRETICGRAGAQGDDAAQFGVIADVEERIGFPFIEHLFEDALVARAG